MEEEKKCKERIQRIVGDGIFAMVIGLGHSLGIFKAFSDIGRPCTADELANQTQLKLRYLEEWLGCMVCGGIIKVADDKYSLPVEAKFMEEQALVANLLPLCGLKADMLQKCMRKDGPSGYDYGSFPEFNDWLDRDRSRLEEWGWIDQNIAPIIELIRTKQGPSLSVLDIGCGTGRLSLALARKYPDLSVYGIDEASDLIDKAEELSREGDGVSNVKFLVEDASSLPTEWKEKFDLIIMLDVLHDLADPDTVMSEMKRILKPDGLFVSFDPLIHSNHAQNSESVGIHFFFSLFVCLPCSMSREPAAGLGGGWGYENKRKYLIDSGFKFVSIANENYDEMTYRVICQKV